jgi:hypothetical protein
MSNSKSTVTLLTPPEHFGIVERGLYRSEMFQQSHFTFIKQLNLKTVVVLSPEQPNRHTLTFLEECGTKLVCMRVRECRYPRERRLSLFNPRGMFVGY